MCYIFTQTYVLNSQTTTTKNPVRACKNLSKDIIYRDLICFQIMKLNMNFQFFSLSNFNHALCFYLFLPQKSAWKPSLNTLHHSSQFSNSTYSGIYVYMPQLAALMVYWVYIWKLCAMKSGFLFICSHRTNQGEY